MTEVHVTPADRRLAILARWDWSEEAESAYAEWIATGVDPDLDEGSILPRIAKAVAIMRAETDRAAYQRGVADAVRRVREHAEAHRDAPAHWTWACRLVASVSALARAEAERVGIWRCSGCGEGLHAWELPSTRWRCDGGQHEHQCGDPQAGCHPAQFFPWTAAEVVSYIAQLHGQIGALTTLNEDWRHDVDSARRDLAAANELIDLARKNSHMLGDVIRQQSAALAEIDRETPHVAVDGRGKVHARFASAADARGWVTVTAHAAARSDAIRISAPPAEGEGLPSVDDVLDAHGMLPATPAPRCAGCRSRSETPCPRCK